MKRAHHKDFFKGRTALIVTKHGKEKVIAPVLQKSLDIKCETNYAIDTDLLGTFSGERERTDDPITTARKKCLLALEQSNYDMVISSEGSFGSHPSIFFTSADDEILMLIDKKNNLEIFSSELTTETNFNAKQIDSLSELTAFAKEVKFPSHGLILRKSKTDYSIIYKENPDRKTLIRNFNHILQINSSVYVETDMRAMNNPTRMKVIKRATNKLVKKLLSFCPNCNTPGFSVTKVIPGLPCSWCNAPTRSTLSYLYTCNKCNYQKEKKYPKKKRNEDPMYCDRCNP